MTLALYVPRRSVVHRVPAGGKLLALAALAVLLFAVPTLPVVVAALLGVLAVGLGAARLPATALARQARTVRWWLAGLLVFHTLFSDLPTAAVTVLRLLALVLAAAVVTATTRVTEMVAVIERLCAPLRVVGVRPARIGLVISMALRFIPVLAERADRIREAQAARGGSARGIRGLRTTVTPLLVQLLQMAHTISEALDARGADDVPPARGRRSPAPAA
ncbi:energy-coupling factor transporter transmembrane component T family protein [Blastococcus sp. VKM Ac-2987]|uniref:energy-coupling factor transporter transmembrane component T family protein n=1 Tax=Blastococcus sp. VKM Ac-2987 TaxID=3004141 RepID=UPI0022ABB3E8|nr:energy-coupling factor transporter transmembrane component T [Blastococcus sp. VKM Ac-2987]MCZ2857539.1 energy-coupling factor transporter transmembrane component T [Blastococcus sp. VKM Ac-2987]